MTLLQEPCNMNTLFSCLLGVRYSRGPRYLIEQTSPYVDIELNVGFTCTMRGVIFCIDKATLHLKMLQKYVSNRLKWSPKFETIII